MKSTFHALGIVLCLLAFLGIGMNLVPVGVSASTGPGTQKYVQLVYNAFLQFPDLWWNGYEHLFFLVGVFLFAHLLCRKSFLQSILSSAVAVTSVLAIFGDDRLVWSWITWLPLLTTGIFFSFPRANIPNYQQLLGLLATATLLGFSWPGPGLFAPMVYISAICLARCHLPTAARNPLPRVLLLLALLPAWAWWKAPIPQFPTYPSYAQVVPDDGVPGVVRANIGLDVPIPIIDREALKHIGSQPSLLFLAVCLVTLLVLKGERSDPLTKWATCLTLLAVADTLLDEEYALLLPLQVLPRLISGYQLVSLLPLALALSICLLTIRLPWGIGLATLCLWGLSSQHSTFPLFTDSVSLQLARSLESCTVAPSLLASPSLAVAKYYDLDVFRNKPLRFSNPRFFSEALRPTIAASPNSSPEQLALMLDKDRSTRWSLGRPQQGDEELQVRFPSPLSIEGVLLSPGTYSSDFPRGVRLSECGGSIPLAEFPRWLGGIKFTSDGFPYFSRQSTVSIPIRHPEPVHCLSIRQTGVDPIYDWSVAELRLAVALEETSIINAEGLSDSPVASDEEPDSN